MTVSILSENNLDEVDLEGIFYIEGNFEIQSNSQFKGILIMNKGSIIVNPPIELKIEGLVLLKDYADEENPEQRKYNNQL